MDVAFYITRKLYFSVCCTNGLTFWSGLCLKSPLLLVTKEKLCINLSLLNFIKTAIIYFENQHTY
jgi:hypothetical protein